MYDRSCCNGCFTAPTLLKKEKKHQPETPISRKRSTSTTLTASLTIIYCCSPQLSSWLNEGSRWQGQVVGPAGVHNMLCACLKRGHQGIVPQTKKWCVPSQDQELRGGDCDDAEQCRFFPSWEYLFCDRCGMSTPVVGMGFGDRVRYRWRRVFVRYRQDLRKKPGARARRATSRASLKRWALLLVTSLGVGVGIVCEFVVLVVMLGVLRQ